MSKINDSKPLCLSLISSGHCSLVHKSIVHNYQLSSLVLLQSIQRSAFVTAWDYSLSYITNNTISFSFTRL
uniref:Uncharacterized protein n=1 Tax=Nelumbo nucifera TaxID=4432 RepID=A0A823A104_NELNU|nr:TPA_asm: hypothetical protein HUJ06_018643 [Nelumbo nucifera]